MRSIDLHVTGQCCRIFPDASIDALNDLCIPDNTVIISDTNVCCYHGDKLRPYRVIEIEPGEEHKTLKTVNAIYEQLCAIEAGRSWTIVGVGGGIVCDIAGFTASTYMRGISFGFVPTTLLAQVDASVGGKNGVNIQGFKNLAGTFTQPGFVLCDFSFLRTLPYHEIKNGIAEVIKSALISDLTLFEYIENNRLAILSLNKDAFERIINDCLVIKTGIVSRDEKESGERRKLNLGHTIGHAIEKARGYRHGEAISIGIVIAAELSQRRGTLSKEDVVRVKTLLTSFGLPTELKSDKEAVMNAVRKDKKRQGADIHFVFLSGIGNAVVETMSLSELEEVIF
ncbi:MAG: 3-dehydroquinate synthase [Syntrophorhabdaceae bacterium]|nr:3-dehydroquinate synthase [Syntrophorhabdaceae bacterium]MDD4196455.1 3-dehydroquinate synthase [Syntrophorhabdaceae bacterium]